MGEFPQFNTLPMACAALEQIRSWGVASIHRALSAMTEHLAHEAANHGFVAIEPPERAGHFVGLRRSGGIPQALASALAADQVYVSIRGDAIRVAPHLHINFDDMDRLLTILRRPWNT
jgi:selenocysteine lyase/cysteine desulfurase